MAAAVMAMVMVMLLPTVPRWMQRTMAAAAARPRQPSQNQLPHEPLHGRHRDHHHWLALNTRRHWRAVAALLPPAEVSHEVVVTAVRVWVAAVNLQQQ